MADALTPLTPEHCGRGARALDVLKTAQQLIGDAAELLSTIPGLADEWESVRDLYFTVRQRGEAVEAALNLLGLETR